MSILIEFASAAQRLFGMHAHPGRGRLNEYYIPVTANVTENRLAAVANDGDESGPIGPFSPRDPLAFLAPESVVDGQSATAPSIAFVVGQYGVGKTELMFQLCHQLEEQSARAPHPLPVNLALCRDKVHLLKSDWPRDREAAAKNLFELLFSRVDCKNAPSNMGQIVWEAIRSGASTLVLDGVDELLSGWKELHSFLSSLLLVLDSGPPSRKRFRVVLSMRLELLLAVATDDGHELSQIVVAGAPGAGVRAYFLQLGFLQDLQVRAYARRRLRDAEKILADVGPNDPLMETLRRPLLLRIFCDLAATPREGLHKLSNATQLVGHFIDRAVGDQELIDDQASIARSGWDKARLADMSLALYESSRNELAVEDVVKIIAPTPSGPAAEKDALAMIHKLPFLHLVSDNTKKDKVEFSHRIFFEYFVALGMRNREDKAAKGAEETFDELVLNVDMRRFLRDLMRAKDNWYKRTKRSYALCADQLSEWKDFEGPHDFDSLEQNRRVLLDSMTEPELFVRDLERRSEVVGAVNWFLEQKDLHPRYLSYNYEAVVIFVLQQRWTSAAQDVRPRFEKRVSKVFHETIERLSSRDLELRYEWELVLERTLSVALRLRSLWVPRMIDRNWEKLIENSRTRTRVRAICDDARESVF